MKALLKIPFDFKDKAKQIAKDHKSALWWEPISKSWEFSGNSIPDELKPFIIPGSMEVIEENNQNTNNSNDNIDWPDFSDEDTSNKASIKITKPKKTNDNSNDAYIYCVDYPFELRENASKLGLSWNSTYKTYTIRTRIPSENIQPYLSQPFSYESWIEFFLNSKHRPQIESLMPDKDIWEIRPHQKTAGEMAGQAFSSKYSGFLIADQVGLGKTISSLSSLRNIKTKAIAPAFSIDKENNKLIFHKDHNTVLIVTTVAAIAHWRNTLLKFNTDNFKILIINYDRLQKLFKVQDEKYKTKAKSKKAKNKRIKNNSLAPVFDFCIWDESHKMKNSTSMRAKLGRKISDNAQFNLFLSATAGQNPLELSYLIPLLASITGEKTSTMEDFELWCKSMNLGVKRAEFGKWVWDGSQQSIDTIQSLLFKNKPPAAIRRNPTDIAGWPEINRELTHIELSPEQIPLYQAAWDEFKKLKHNEYKSLNNKSLKQKGDVNQLVANLRFRQKASILKIDSTIEYIINGLENNHQVAVSVAFQETLSLIKEKLAKQNIDCSVIHGQISPKEKEQNRMDFQTGKTKVILFTVEEAISLHQGEHNDTPRIMLIHDLRWSAISMNQIEGRTHRDGKFSQIYWLFLTNTIEQDIAQIVLRRLINMNSMVGDDTQVLKDIEKLFMEKLQIKE